MHFMFFRISLENTIAALALYNPQKGNFNLEWHPLNFI